MFSFGEALELFSVSANSIAPFIMQKLIWLPQDLKSCWKSEVSRNPVRFSNELNECWKYQNKEEKFKQQMDCCYFSTGNLKMCIDSWRWSQSMTSRGDHEERSKEGIQIVLCMFLFFLSNLASFGSVVHVLLITNFTMLPNSRCHYSFQILWCFHCTFNFGHFFIFTMNDFSDSP